MKIGLIVALLMLPCLAQASAKFQSLREKAEPLGGLGAFLDGYVGDCAKDLLNGAECQQNAAAFRSSAKGKRYYMVVAEDAASIALGGASGEEVTLNVTPFFGASGSAVTQGAPSRTDAQGNPVLPFIRVKGTLPEGIEPSTFSRMVAMRALRLEVIFTPQGLWQLPKKGGGKIRGVKAKIEGLLVKVGRTGQEIATWTAK